MKLRTTLVLLILWSTLQAQSDREVYMFSYFKGNGEDGLHLAFSDDGYAWRSLHGDSSFLKPSVGKDKLMRDPCIIRTPDGIFHMVWTTGWNDKGIGYASSKDLVHWSEQKYIPVMQHEKDARNCWAPEIFYDPRTEQYMIFWSTTITGRFTETQSEKENAYNHRIYYVLTNDFKNFSEAALLYDNGFNVIDATIQFDFKSKTYFMFLKDETVDPPQKNIRIATSNRVTDRFSRPGKPITGNYWAEGPTVVNIKGQWIVYFDKYVDHKMGAVRSEDLTTWTDISAEVRFPEGVRHGSVFPLTYSVLSDEIKKHIPK